MAMIDQLKLVVKESSALSERGKNEAALQLLDDAIAQAIHESRNTWVCVLSRHASVIADEMGDLRLVRAYREQCLAHDPENPLALSSLADVLHRQGEDKLAKQYAARSYQVSVRRNTELDRALMESLLQIWPDLATWRG